VTGQATGSEVAACIFLAVGVFGASLVPWLLLVDAEHLTPRFVRELPTTCHKAACTALLNAAVLLLLATPNGDAR
jgi:hypothetical protein